MGIFASTRSATSDGFEEKAGRGRGSPR
jgi:hypothetical protein